MTGTVSVREPQAGVRAASVTTTRPGLTAQSASRARPELDYQTRQQLRQLVSDLYLARARQQDPDMPEPERPVIPGVCYRAGCGQAFEPRDTGGGVAQKFCCAKCRQQHCNDMARQRKREAR